MAVIDQTVSEMKLLVDRTVTGASPDTIRRIPVDPMEFRATLVWDTVPASATVMIYGGSGENPSEPLIKFELSHDEQFLRRVITPPHTHVSAFVTSISGVKARVNLTANALEI
jgi:hypothetical protein